MGARELGNPMGNPLALPNKRGGVSVINPTIVDFTGVDGSTIISGTYLLPAGYSFFRVTVVGGGGSGLPASPPGGGGGGGGGLSRSAILPAVTGLAIAWQAGNPSTGTDPGGASFANFGAISLQATGGQTPTGGTGGVGGVGSGGADNWAGGNGGSASSGAGGGGGAAGIDGNGANGGNGRATGQSSGCTGGGGGGGQYSTTTTNYSGGGGGVGANGAPGNITDPVNYGIAGAAVNFFGTPAPLFTGRGGNWGGGGGSNLSGGKGFGGFGGVRIELW
ncbi:hypothetical protein SAMN05216205_4940 [Pseudomonas mohnii]|uniref:PE-PGRS family protein n=1 Tax=Pseudomonas mohnii TaxID=395600 RepID=A0ABY0YCH5_9PSED|nr:hypothetical protein SAMN05216205_4940 [Pseudomonas mohnii]